MSATGTVERDGRLRLFCALRLPDETLDRLAEWQNAELAGQEDVRVLARDHLHVTLAFLGSRAREDVAAISAALRDAASAAEPPLLQAERYRETRSVGMLVLAEEAARAVRLALDLQERLEGLGVYRREARPWLPHVTVVRFRTRPRLRPQVPDLGAFSPSDAALYYSVLRSGGAQYEIMDSFALGGRY